MVRDHGRKMMEILLGKWEIGESQGGGGVVCTRLRDIGSSATVARYGILEDHLSYLRDAGR